MSFCMVVCQASQVLLRAGGCLLTATTTFVQQKREQSWVFCTRMLGICSREWDQDLSSPLPKPPYKHIKQSLCSRYCLKNQQSISWKKQKKIVKFSNRRKEKTVLSKGNRKWHGMTLKSETKSHWHTQKRKERIMQKRGCSSINFSIMPINLITKQYRCLHTYWETIY